MTKTTGVLAATLTGLWAAQWADQTMSTREAQLPATHGSSSVSPSTAGPTPACTQDTHLPQDAPARAEVPPGPSPVLEVDRVHGPERWTELQRQVVSTDEAAARTAIRALADAATEESVRALLDSMNQSVPLPNAHRFEIIVEETRGALDRHRENAGLAITVESLMTTSPSELTRAAAVAALSDSMDDTGRKQLLRAFNKVYSNDQSRLVHDFARKALDGDVATAR